MGSFNTTCHISSLPIAEGDEVMMFHIVKNWDYDKGGWTCYPWDRCEIIGLPYIAKYADYGKYEVEGMTPELSYTLSYLKSLAVPREVGDNEYHDIPVTPETFDYEQLEETVWEGRLQVKNSRNVPVEVYNYPVLKAVYDKAIEMVKNQENRDYHKPLNLEEFKDGYSKLSVDDNDPKYYIERMRFQDKIGRQLGFGVGNSHYHLFMELSEIIDMYDKSGININDAFNRLMEVSRFVRFMQITNRQFMPVMTSGQEYMYDFHHEFNQFLADHTDVLNRKFKHWCGEDEEE